MKTLAGCKVLVIEDEALVAMMIEDALTYVDAVVIGPHMSVARALAEIERGTPDIAVLDLDLCGESAFQVADALSARNVPYVIATGFHHSDLPPRYASSAVLCKPFAMDELIDCLSSVMSGRQLLAA